MENTGITSRDVIRLFTLLGEDKTRYGHSDSYKALMGYIPEGTRVVKGLPEFTAHALSYYRDHGKVRNSKVAMSVLSTVYGEDEIRSNGQAHIALLNPRQMEQGLRFSYAVGKSSAVVKVVDRWLAHVEQNQQRWTGLAVNFRRSLKALYALTHRKPSKVWYGDVLFKKEYQVGGVFEFIAGAQDTSVYEIMEYAVQHKLPSTVLGTMLGTRLKDKDALLVYMNNLTPAQVVIQAEKLKKLGVMDHAACRAMFERKLKESVGDRDASYLRTDAAVGAIISRVEGSNEDEYVDEQSAILAAKLSAVREKQMDVVKGSMQEADVLILADKSGSMQGAIEGARIVAALAARLVNGKVHLVFFDEGPRYFDTTGMSYEQIEDVTKRVTAGGNTSIGVGLDYMLKAQHGCDVIIVITDGQENSYPSFVDAYTKYCTYVGKDVPVYVFRVGEYLKRWHDSIDVTEIDCTTQAVSTQEVESILSGIRVNKYSLVDEIYNTPLLTLGEVLV